MVYGDNIIYVRIDWENYPSDKTPVNERNLNKMDLAIHLLDERVVWLNENKFDKTESFKLVKNIDLDEDTGIFTITYYDNTTKIIDTILEKVATNWDYDKVSQQLIITLDDGTVKRVDLSALITQYEFMTSDTISFEAQPDGKVKALLREGSIQEKHLRPDYLADIRVEQGRAKLSAEEAESYANLSESYTRGGTGIRENEDADNAMEYARQARESEKSAEQVIKDAVLKSEKGEPNGVASLDENGKVPQSQFPDLKEVIGDLFRDQILDLSHPIGSIYTSSNPADPGTLFGGTWVQIKDTFLLTAGDTYQAGTTGGEVSHTLSVAEIPLHGHGYSGITGNDNNDHTHGFSANTGTVSADHVHGGYTSTGGDHTHQAYVKKDVRLTTGGTTSRISGVDGSAGSHTTSISGSHNHTVQTYGISANHTHGVSGTTGGRNAFHQHAYSGTTAGTGSGAAHNNMPPYRVVYAWERTA